MTTSIIVALLALALVASSARPGDGRTETAVALPLVAARAVVTPAALLTVLGGVAVAYGALVALERRTLLFGRRLRALTAIVGATVPLSIFALALALGRAPPLPEVWLAGAVVPGVLAYDLRRQSLDRRTVVAVVGTAVLCALVLAGLLASVVFVGVPANWWTVGPDTLSAGVPLAVLAPLVLGALAAGVLVRWRYGLHVGTLSVPLVAIWSIETLLIPLAYVCALFAVWAIEPALRQRSSGRRLAALGGLFGALTGAGLLALGGVLVVGTAGLAVVLTGVLAAEDARMLREHAGRDRTHAVAIGASLYALVLAGAGVAAGSMGVTGAATTASPPRAVVVAVVLALAVLAAVVLQRERSRPSERRLRTEERRWTP